VFDGSKYAFWSIRMKRYLKALGYGVWSAVENVYTTLETPPIDAAEKKLNYYDSKAMSTIQCGLEELEFFILHQQRICGTS
jgi:hypothetical protein